MSYYRDTDPRRLVWEAINDMQKVIKQMEYVLDALLVDLDDGKHWVTEEIEVDRDD